MDMNASAQDGREKRDYPDQRPLHEAHRVGRFSIAPGQIARTRHAAWKNRYQCSAFIQTAPAKVSQRAAVPAAMGVVC